MMVNVFSIVCFSTLLLSNFVGATADLHQRRSRHHNGVRVEAIQRRAAEEHHAVMLADRSMPKTPSEAVRRKRANGRCSARPTTATTSLVLATTSTHKAVHTTTAPIVNPGGDPTTISTKGKPTTTSHAETTSKKAVQKPASTTSKAVTTTKASGGGGSGGGGGGGGGGGSGTTYHGDGTYYGTGLGSCGWTNKDSDMIVAVSQLLYDNYPGATANPNNNPICGRHITASYGGKSVTVKVVDRCVGCAERDLDFSPDAFTSIASKDLGRIQISWQWAD